MPQERVPTVLSLSPPRTTVNTREDWKDLGLPSTRQRSRRIYLYRISQIQIILTPQERIPTILPLQPPKTTVDTREDQTDLGLPSTRERIRRICLDRISQIQIRTQQQRSN